MNKKFENNNFYEAWHFLYEHPLFKDEYGNSKFIHCLDVDVVKVNPVNCEIDKDESLNTKIEIWFECGKYDKKSYWHDYDLDCGGDTYEEAIINLANNVYICYGEQKEKLYT